MPKQPRTLEALQRAEALTGPEVCQLAGIPYPTLKHYAREGLLPFTQDQPRATRYFNREATLARLQEIQQARAAGRSLKQIAATMGRKIAFTLAGPEVERLREALQLARKAAPRRDDFATLEARIFAGFDLPEKDLTL